MSMKDKSDKELFDLLSHYEIPDADEQTKNTAVDAAVSRFEAAAVTEQEKSEKIVQELEHPHRPNSIINWIGDLTMKKLYIVGGVAACGVFTFALTNSTMLTQIWPEHEAFEHKISDGLQSTVPNLPAKPSDDKDVSTVYRQEKKQERSDTPAAPGEASGRTLLKEMEEEIFAESDAVSGPLPAASPPPVVTGGHKAKIMGQVMSNEAFAPAMMATPKRMIAPAPMPDVIVPQPPEYVGRDKFEDIEDSPIKLVTEEPVSTFSIDVDTASYSFVRRQINNGVLPQPDAVRVEEMVNYFDYDYPGTATKEEPFGTSVTVFDTPWNQDTKLMHIGIQGFDIDADEKPRSNLVFLIDTSGSMSSQDKLPLLKNAFKLMVEHLDEDDTVAIATYAGSAGTVLEPTKVKDKQKIIAALNRLHSGGSTAGAAGIKLAYELAEANFDKEAVNRVFLATDGDFNVGITNREELKGFIERKRETGVFLSVLGFGQGNYNDALMQTLAQNGNGVAAYIDSLNEARKLLVEEASSTMFPIAKDVKLQIEFNPQQIKDYRLIGYRTRILNREDFNNDKVDAGEIGSGHTVTAIYEVTPTDSQATHVDPLRYGKKTEEENVASDVAASDELAFLKIRYKLPQEDQSTLITLPVTGEAHGTMFDKASDDVRFATAVAAFGQQLRGGKFLGGFGYDDIIELANGAKGKDEFGYRAEFVNLVRLAKSMPAM